MRSFRIGAFAEFGYIDHDDLRSFLKGFPSRPHTPLLETLLDEIVDKCFADQRVDACHVSIMKLDIFNEGSRPPAWKCTGPGRTGRDGLHVPVGRIEIARPAAVSRR